MSDCVIWTGSLDGHGYGTFRMGRMVKAHRVAYEAMRGPIPAGMVIDHLCRNRACVNVEHLEAVTPRENGKRGLNYNGQKTHCKSGHPFSEANTRFLDNGHRRCITCVRAFVRKSKQKRKEKLHA